MKTRTRFAGLVIAGIGMLGTRATAQDCGAIHELLRQGHSVLEVSRVTGLSTADVRACAGQMRRQRRLISPEGPAPHGAPGPAPHGAAGPPPLGAAGPPPHGAAGPAPFGEQK